MLVGLTLRVAGLADTPFCGVPSDHIRFHGPVPVNAAWIVVDPPTQIDALPTAAENQSGMATAASLASVASAVTTVDTVVDAILVDTAEIGAAGAGLVGFGLLLIWAARRRRRHHRRHA